MNNFHMSNKGFVVRGHFPRGYYTRAYAESVECMNYKEVLKAILKFMEIPSVYAIQVINNETGEKQHINDNYWKYHK